MFSISNLFRHNRLQEENVKLQREVDSLKQKLVEKQEHINKTNKYYKGKLKNLGVRVN